MKGPMKIHYDEKGDFLEIAIGKPSECYAEEVKPGIFVRRTLQKSQNTLFVFKSFNHY